MANDDRNFLGLPLHESDEYLHWTDKIDEVLKMREAWDAIPKRYRKHVIFLIERGKHLAEMSQAERDAGEAL